MNSIALGFHDILYDGVDDSGFTGNDAFHYKLDGEQFAAILALSEDCEARAEGMLSVEFTFDDGGDSAKRAADILERENRRGHFFVATQFVGANRFLGVGDLRDLHARGHVIGSHSHSHPIPFDRLTIADARSEWSRSCGLLRDWLGAPVLSGALPGGGISHHALLAASESLLTTIYTSEPTGMRWTPMPGLECVGRFSATRGSTLSSLRKVIEDDGFSRRRIQAFWNAKRCIKSIAWPVWNYARRSFFSMRA